MNNEIKVSISCVTFNHKRYIEQALCSFLMQRTDFKFEILVHDDCSTDGTQEIIKKYEKMYPEIVKPIYQQENQFSKGLSITFTYQYPRAKGKYIAICEGDDYWIDPLKLQKQVDFMEANPSFSLCGSNGLIVWEELYSKPSYFNNNPISHQCNISELTKKWMFPTSTFLLKKEVVENYPEWTKKIYAGDQTMILVAFARGNVYYHDELFSIYRKSKKNPYSASNTYGSNLLYARKQQLLRLEAFDQWTDYAYHQDIKPAIIEKKNEVKYLQYHNINRLLPYFLMPFYTIRRKREYKKNK